MEGETAGVSHIVVGIQMLQVFQASLIPMKIRAMETNESFINREFIHS
jgi:hypothetical protein